MKLTVVLLVTLFGLALARPQQPGGGQEVKIVRFDSENKVEGGYQFAYELSDGQTREEQGELKNAGTDDEAISVSGSYKFVGPDGKTYTVTYTADENGFRPITSIS